MDILSNIEALHLEHKKWLENVKFYRDLVELYSAHLMRLSGLNIEDKEFKKQLEVLQNELIIEESQLSDLHHFIDRDEKSLKYISPDAAMKDKIRYFNNHLDLNDKMERFYCLFNELKKKYLRFCIKWQK
ncbi:hypothetical protein K5X82_02275 [Halosquirtibacter xylanolyticus]|uniref:hypothetical protein n=1 Tax=Halosquirtibacter xylanolyticus TaxID=3374599 RepID=UPI0037481274|nr:hypothetical protein K5X82_02275 [Prolixibacteraceae bacterium]